ncbi:MAG: TIGR03905 family TSCPD domain-containing protein [Clostridiales bacterium]|nr:TIGR03905 family TSCPD domain-containing protein [Clostridiales bacterium]
MTYTYIPKGVCSRKMTVEIADGIVKSACVEGGCSGNLQGLTRLIVGMKATEAIEKLQGIRCGFKSTSCPDQLAKALAGALQQ